MSLKKKIGIGCGSCAFLFVLILVLSAIFGSKQPVSTKIEGTEIQTTISPVASPSILVPSPEPSPTPTKTSTKTPTLAPTRTPPPQTEAPRSNCDPNYSGACVPIASDVDCAGGSGNGPAFVRGPVYVIGRDIYGLDRDHDGVGCE